jgi:hypothetical protein
MYRRLPEAYDERQQVRAGDHRSDANSNLHRRADQVAYPSLPDLATVAPGGELTTLRPADTDQLSALADLGEPDVVGGEALRRIVELLLAFLDRLPALVQRRQVPAPAALTDDPQPPLLLVEGEAAADGKILDGLVSA